MGNDVIVKNNDVAPSKPSPGATVEKLAALTYHKGEYTLEQSIDDSTEQDSNIYYVIKYLNYSQQDQQGCYYNLKENDVIRFGRVKYLVKEIKRPLLPFPPSTVEISSVPPQIDESLQNAETEKLMQLPLATETEADSCRICRSEKNTVENPLLSICKCSGSIKFIHAECMKAWYQSKMIVRSTRCVDTYTIKGLECELCKTILPLTVMNNGSPINLVEIKKPQAIPYLVLESIDKVFKNTKYVHVAHFADSSSIAKIVLFIIV